ncbi:hypothetical protein H4219_004343 [Mycoemilia scoparia]|uniref:Uncharacterized protein n=1 Tax=Mycoemilia scoparia TaxID=417184 RepID=A0A9W8DN06_9FUNG|nr:hypothetical protein H4219_004343 [Mycoemilia scoparia]
MNKIRRKFSFWDTSHPQSVLAKNTLTRKPVYMGIVFQEEENTLMWASSCYDGSEYLGFHEDTLDVGDVLDTTARWHSAGNKILHTLMQYATSHNYRMQAVCFGYDKKLLEKYGDSDMDPLRVVSSRFWFEADVIPYITEVKGMSLEEEAASAARKIVDW